MVPLSLYLDPQLLLRSATSPTAHRDAYVQYILYSVSSSEDQVIPRWRRHMTCTRDRGAIVADCDIHVFAFSWLVQVPWERGVGRRNGPGSSFKCQCYLLVDGRFCSHLRFPIASRSRTRCRDPPAVAWSFTRNIILHRHIETSPDHPSYSASNGARDGDNTAALHLLLILFSYGSWFSQWWEASRGMAKSPHLLISASADVYGLRRILGGNLCRFDANNSHVVRISSVSVDGSPISLI